MKIYWLFPLMVACSTGYAQTFNQQLVSLKTVIPPSPDAASLGKYGEWPVSLYTGVPQISIPIYELKGRSISVPISLSYHASGIRVGEIASLVGLGWTLNAGGAITRSVAGLPDETPTLGFLDFRKTCTYPADLNPISTADRKKIVERKLDGEPDVYYLNALGKSYRLYFNENDVITTHPFSKLKIKADFANKQFTVLMEDGTKLIFGGTNFVESTNSDGISSQVSSANNFISSWLLKSIITTNNETISFAYSFQTVTYDGSISESDSRYSDIWPTLGDDPLPHTVSVGSNMITQSQLTSIQSDLISVSFIPETSMRQDLPSSPGSYALSSIKVKNIVDNVDLFEYKLVYSYSDASAYGSCATGRSGGIYAKRLKLNYLRELKPNTTQVNKEWLFEYNSQSLPSRASFSQDHWGYFNGTGNTVLAP